MTIESPLDQSIFIPDIANKLYDIAQILGEVEKTKNLEPAIDLLTDLRVAQQLSGLEMAMALSGLRKIWGDLGIGDEFEDFIMSAIGISKQTITKYIRIWEVIFENSDIHPQYRNKLATKPMKGLLLLPAAIREGDLTDEDMLEIVNAPDVATIREVVRKARGQQTSSKNAIVIMLNRDGTLVATRDGVMETIGYLNKVKVGGNDITSVAVERIIRTAGVVLQ